jgi:hypothetical protein
MFIALCWLPFSRIKFELGRWRKDCSYFACFACDLWLFNGGGDAGSSIIRLIVVSKNLRRFCLTVYGHCNKISKNILEFWDFEFRDFELFVILSYSWFWVSRFWVSKFWVFQDFELVGILSFEILSFSRFWVSRFLISRFWISRFWVSGFCNRSEFILYRKEICGGFGNFIKTFLWGHLPRHPSFLLSCLVNNFSIVSPSSPIHNFIKIIKTFLMIPQ